MSPVAEPPLTAPSGTSSGVWGVPRPQSGPWGSEVRSPPTLQGPKRRGRWLWQGWGHRASTATRGTGDKTRGGGGGGHGKRSSAGGFRRFPNSHKQREKK